MVEFPKLGIHSPKEGRFIPLREIHKKFSTTEYGYMLEGNVRFGKFRPDHVSIGEWKKTLGADVCNLQHHPFTLGGLIRILSYQEQPPQQWSKDVRQFSPYEINELAFAAIVHDWAEAKIGDIAYPLKTISDQERENLILADMLEEVLGLEKNSRVTTKTIEIIDGSNPILGKTFKAAEVTGYHGTAVKALQNSINEKDVVLSENLKLLAISTLGNINSLLLQAARFHPGVMVDISKRAALVSDVFKSANDQTVQRLADIKMGKDSERFNLVRDEWFKFTDSPEFKSFTRPKATVIVNKVSII